MREQPTRVTRWTRAGALLALILAAELTLGATAGAAEPVDAKCPVNPTPAERLQNPQRYVNTCPPGQRIEVAFGDTSLLFDPAWLPSASIARLNDQTGCLCPEEAVSGFPFLQISGPPPAGRRLLVERGLPDYIRIREARPRDTSPADFPTNPSSRRYLPGGGYIEDVTDPSVWVSPAEHPTHKSYRLQLPATATDPDPAPFTLGCGGTPDGPLGRRCRTGSFRYGDDIIVSYEFRQDRYPHRDERWPTPDGTISEPDGFLAMAARLRAWLDEIRKDRGTP